MAGEGDYLDVADAEVCLLVQAETVTALANLAELAEICAVDGIDGVFIGPATQPDAAVGPSSAAY